jgi:hypothetical protein
MMWATTLWAVDHSVQAHIGAEPKPVSIDTSTANARRIETLSKRFGVPPGIVQDLRTREGWGDVTTRLSLAQRLVQSDPGHYPTMDAALEKIEELRAAGKGWSEISDELGVKPGPVVRAAHQAPTSMNAGQPAPQPPSIPSIPTTPPVTAQPAPPPTTRPAHPHPVHPTK